MADSPRRGFTLASLVLALVAAGVAAALAAVYLTSPLDDPTLSAQVAVQTSAGDVVLAALVAVALSAISVASLYAAWRRRVRLAVRFTCAALMAAAGLLAALTLDPASANLQSRFGVYAHGEGRDQLLGLFTPWVDRMAMLSWIYAACGLALLALTLLAILMSQRQHGRQSRGVVRAV
jgi:hypothetical protein